MEEEGFPPGKDQFQLEGPFELRSLKFTHCPAQMVVSFTEKLATGAGQLFTVTEIQDVELVPQELEALTQIFPEVFPKVTIIFVVPCPDEIVAPEGTVHT